MTGRGGAVAFDPLPIIRAALADVEADAVYAGETPLPLVQGDPEELRAWLRAALRRARPGPARLHAGARRHDLLVRVEQGGDTWETRLPLAVLEPPAGLA